MVQGQTEKCLEGCKWQQERKGGAIKVTLLWVVRGEPGRAGEPGAQRAVTQLC